MVGQICGSRRVVRKDVVRKESCVDEFPGVGYVRESEGS